MDKENNSQNYDIGMKSKDRREQHNQENLKKQHQGEGSHSSIGEE